MSYQYVIIDVDGQEVHVSSEKKPSLKEMQEMVDGRIELVACRYENQRRPMIINEEGKLNRLKLNSKATDMYLDLHDVKDYIVGNAIIFKNFEIDD